MTTTAVSNKVIVITGGASGLGLATAHLLASRGARLSIADVDASNLESAVASIKSQTPEAAVMTRVVDVRNVAQVDEWIAATVQQYGRLDGAANLAGVIGKSIGIAGVKDLEQEEWDFIIGVNLTGVMNCMRAELRVMQDGGSIVSASSVAGIRGQPCNAAYTASKHGVIGLTTSAAREVGDRNIRVNAICPGYIETPMTKLSDKIHEEAGKIELKKDGLISRVPLKRAGQPPEVANLIAFLLGDESSFISGAAYTVDGGLTC